MNTLALETTDKIGSVAAVSGDKCLTELRLDPKLRSAQSLVPAMHALLQQVGWMPKDVQLVAVSVGPGSFTGLRVGVTAAKVFAYCVGAEVLGISTLETIAAAAVEAEAIPCCSEVSAVMDAQRGDVVAQRFAIVCHSDCTMNAPSEPTVEAIGPQELIPADAWLTGLAPGVVVTGPGLVKLAGRLPERVRELPASYWAPRAAVVGRLASRYHAAGRHDDVWKLAPHYFRRSAAEEKWDAMGR
ncbi:MAG: tRNA (adenosine(37)-N6)-threonylcarbamoyltransferase complex dimerization subunit type 1 TsaB [Planctomycetaceae bacterium]|nr:tRNA (adenosine(37)-N6)-threonylcarbamoyltransferase complex dimerization subunit type 1 TsaB [Planctomycetaceae bacterium]